MISIGWVLLIALGSFLLGCLTFIAFTEGYSKLAYKFQDISDIQSEKLKETVNLLKKSTKILTSDPRDRYLQKQITEWIDEWEGEEDEEK